MFTFGGGINPTSLQTLAAGVTQAFASCAAQIQTTWFKQHDRKGGHTDVTAVSLAITAALTANGRINIGAPLHVRRPLEADTMPFYPGSGGRQGAYQFLAPPVEGGRDATRATFIRIQTSSLDPSPFLWHGLDAAGRSEGDVVVFLNSGNEVVEFVIESASTPAGTRFCGGSVGASTRIELHSGAIGIAVYSHNNFLGGLFWHLLCVS